MPRLIWVFAGRTLILLVLSCSGLNAWQVLGLLIRWPAVVAIYHDRYGCRQWWPVVVAIYHDRYDCRKRWPMAINSIPFGYPTQERMLHSVCVSLGKESDRLDASVCVTYSSSRLVSDGLATTCDCGTPWTFHLIFECVSQSCTQLTATFFFVFVCFFFVVVVLSVFHKR